MHFLLLNGCMETPNIQQVNTVIIKFVAHFLFGQLNFCLNKQNASGITKKYSE